MHLDIDKNVYDSLPEEGGVKYFYVREAAGSNREITYDKTEVRAYVLETMITMLTDDEPVFNPETIRIISEQTMTLGGDWNNVFYFENTYEKIQPSDNPPAKAGPQLNRDDHVAYIMGYPDGTVQPDKKITRAETVTMINRVLERVPAKESRLLSRSIMLTFPDNEPGEWYYIAIQEASNSHEYQRSVYETAGDEMWTKLRENVDWTKLEK